MWTAATAQSLAHGRGLRGEDGWGEEGQQRPDQDKAKTTAAPPGAVSGESALRRSWPAADLGKLGGAEVKEDTEYLGGRQG